MAAACVSGLHLSHPDLQEEADDECESRCIVLSTRTAADHSPLWQLNQQQEQEQQFPDHDQQGVWQSQQQWGLSEASSAAGMLVMSVLYINRGQCRIAHSGRGTCQSFPTSTPHEPYCAA